jgi:hypothetical protein
MANLDQPELLCATTLPNGQMRTLTSTQEILHVAVNSTKFWDVVTIEATNSGTSDYLVTVQWGDINAGGVVCATTVPARTTRTIVDRRRVNAGIVIKAASNGPGVVHVHCAVDRYPANSGVLQ